MGRNAVFLPPSLRRTYAPTPPASTPVFGTAKRSGSGVSPLGDIESMHGITISRKTFEEIENFIADNEASIEKVNAGIDLLVRSMVLVIKGIAQQKSGGPIAPRRRSNPALANRIPVQRITGMYFAGWTIRRVGAGHWAVYNDTTEAWLIEFGLHQRVRRPILKMSLIGMLGMIQTTRTAERFMDWVLAPRRSPKGQFQSFSTRLMGTQTLGGMAGPIGRLP